MAPPPERARMALATRQLHESVDAGMRRHHRAFLNPDGESIQVDLLGSQRMIEWQEEKARRSFLGEACWSELPTVYARYVWSAKNKVGRSSRQRKFAERSLRRNRSGRKCRVRELYTAFRP